MHVNRRSFLGQMGFAVVGASTARWGGTVPLLGADQKPLHFGALEELAARMQDQGADALQSFVIGELRRGVPLERLTAGAALANARTFGGEDYVGYHVMMALLPALDLASVVPPSDRALPLLKVIHRNARRIEEFGGRRKERMRELTVDSAAQGDLLEESRRGLEEAREIFASEVDRDPVAALSQLQPVVRDNIDVHQVVLTWRSWDMIRVVGQEHTRTMMVQALRQCVSREGSRRQRGRAAPSLRRTLPAALQRHGLVAGAGGKRQLSNDELDELTRQVVCCDRDDVLELVAGHLANGVDPACIEEAVALASLKLLLHDPGRSRNDGDKLRGTVHGASVGVHACDSANAWRHLAEHVDAPNRVATVLTAAWHTAGRGSTAELSAPFHASARSEAARVSKDRVLDELDRAVQAGEQALAGALTERFGESGGETGPLLQRLAAPLINQDGALHHEKFFHTAVEEFGRTRPAYRWQWMAGLARVAASGRGFPAPGVAEARAQLRGV